MVNKLVRNGLTCITAVVFAVLGVASAAGYRHLVFSACAELSYQPESGDSDFSSTLQNLFSSLKSKASAAYFSRATAGSLSGLFQCRGDLPSSSDCGDCVEAATKQVEKRCNVSAPPAARIQLDGCYISYSEAGIGSPQMATAMLYHLCGDRKTPGLATGSGFGVSPGVEAIYKIENQMVNGFYGGKVAAGNGSLTARVVAQCERDMAGDECKECINSAAESLKNSCNDTSVSGQMYLQKCFVAYSFNGYTDASPSGDYIHLHLSKKAWAIIFGLLGGLVMVVAFIGCVIKSFFKKDNITQVMPSDNGGGAKS